MSCCAISFFNKFIVDIDCSHWYLHEKLKFDELPIRVLKTGIQN